MGRRARNITAQRFGSLVALWPTDRRYQRSPIWVCRCDCDTIVEMTVRRLDDLFRPGCDKCLASPRGLEHASTIDLTGQRFGGLTAISIEPPKPGQPNYWRCLCDCGNESVARAKDLRLGTTKSCGCGAGRPKFYRVTKHGAPMEPGAKFGLLTVSKFLYVQNGGRQYLCECECGGTSIVRGGLLTSGQTRSCGCMRTRLNRGRLAA